MAFGISVEPFGGALTTGLTIARGTQLVADTAIVHVAWDELDGLGEAAPIARYGETVSNVVDVLRAYRPPCDDPFLLDRMLAGIAPAIKCGLDIAFHDVLAKRLGLPLWRFLGVDPRSAPQTAYTIGIGAPDDVERLALAHAHLPILKIKLGGGNEIETLEALRSVYTGSIYIDANEAWTPEQAVNLLRELQRFGVELCEQPIPAGTPERLRWIRERVGIPIVADEDAVVAADLGPLRECVDGVNVKLAKCGGIRAALEMIHTARALGMKILLGCMVETSILATAAAHVSPLVDWADIDGPLLLAADPYAGVRYDNGNLTLPDGPGLGVTAVR